MIKPKSTKPYGLIGARYVGHPAVLKGPFDKRKICHSVNWEHGGHKPRNEIPAGVKVGVWWVAAKRPNAFFMCAKQNYLTLLDDEDHTLESLKIRDEQHLVIEGLPITQNVFFFFFFIPVMRIN